MPSAGRKNSKYVRKVHYSRDWPVGATRVTTRCGKKVLPYHAVLDARKVTCKICLLILDIPPGGCRG